MFFHAGNAKNLGECGGTAVTAKTLTCVGALNVTLVGGNGATGVTGVTGTTGYTGQKGNNESQGKNLARNWERIYLEEGEAGFYIERRGRTTKMDNPKKGRPRKKPLDKQVENDLIAENQRLKEELEYLRAENEYIKKLSALIAAEKQKKSKKQK